MAYEKHEWVIGETITADLLNNMENGIEDALTKGNGYVLTEADKQEISQLAAALVDAALLDTIGTGEVTV